MAQEESRSPGVRRFVSGTSRFVSAVRRFVGPAAAVLLGIVLWRVLVRMVNGIVQSVFTNITLTEAWQRRQATAVLVMTFLLSAWVAYRIIYPPENFD